MRRRKDEETDLGMVMGSLNEWSWILFIKMNDDPKEIVIYYPKFA